MEKEKQRHVTLRERFSATEGSRLPPGRDTCTHAERGFASLLFETGNYSSYHKDETGFLRNNLYRLIPKRIKPSGVVIIYKTQLVCHSKFRDTAMV